MTLNIAASVNGQSIPAFVFTDPLLAYPADKPDVITPMIGGHRVTIELPIGTPLRSLAFEDVAECLLRLGATPLKVKFSTGTDTDGGKVALPVKSKGRKVPARELLLLAMREHVTPITAPQLLAPDNYTLPPAQLPAAPVQETVSEDTAPQDNGDTPILDTAPAADTAPVQESPAESSPAADIVPPAVRRRGRSAVVNGQS